MAVTTGLDLPEAHTATIADKSVCPIVTLDPSRWEEPSHLLEHALVTLELAEVDEPAE